MPLIDGYVYFWQLSEEQHGSPVPAVGQAQASKQNT